MNSYELPTSLNIAGVDYPIRYDFRPILDILIAMNDSDLPDQAKSIVILKILYPQWREIPMENLEEALKKACDFIDCGQKDDGRPKPQVIDWEQDAAIIIPAINHVAHMEVRAVPSLHWWTFFSYFMEIQESLFSSVIHIRQKKARHKKLEGWEKEFYRENQMLIDLDKKDSAEIMKEKEGLLKWL